MFAGIDFTSGDTEVLSKKAFRFNKTLLGVLILTAALLLAGCGGAKSTRAKADETVHTALFDFTCGQPETIEKFGNIAIPEGDKLVQFHISVTNTSDETYDIFKGAMATTISALRFTLLRLKCSRMILSWNLVPRLKAICWLPCPAIPPR